MFSCRRIAYSQGKDLNVGTYNLDHLGDFVAYLPLG